MPEAEQGCQLSSKVLDPVGPEVDDGGSAISWWTIL